MQDYDGPLNDGMTMKLMHAPEILGDEDEVEVMRTLYAGEVNLADQYLGRFLDHLEASGRLDNTVIIFTADHGQTLGEGGRHGHGPNHRESVIRVPFILADFRRRQPSESALRVGTIDIAPTIAAAAGLDQAFDYAGRSLMELDGLQDHAVDEVTQSADRHEVAEERNGYQQPARGQRNQVAGGGRERSSK